MTLRIRKKSSPGSGAPAGGSTASTGNLRPDLLAAGARRLATIALIGAAASVLFAVVDRIVTPFDPRSGVSVLWLLAVLGSLGLSLSVAWIAYREMLSPEKLLDLGLLYEVVEALFLGIMFHSMTIRPDVMPRGWSAVAVWILAYPLIVPNTRGKTTVATIAAALMDPAALAVNVAVGGTSPTMSLTAIMFLPTAVACAVALVVSRIVFDLAMAAGKGQEMGSYRLEELLGRGGMGEVWRASHRLLARQAAVKLIRLGAGSDSRELFGRFEREARATAGLRSPHTVDVYDFGTTEDGTFYYVMELLEGFDLETLVHRFGRVPPERALYLLEQACHSLAEAHEGGLIHRDVKPANIYVCRYGLDWDFVKLLDFGLDDDGRDRGHARLYVAGDGARLAGRRLEERHLLARVRGLLAPDRAPRLRGRHVHADSDGPRPEAAHSPVGVGRGRPAARARSDHSFLPREGPGQPTPDGARAGRPPARDSHGRPMDRGARAALVARQRRLAAGRRLRPLDGGVRSAGPGPGRGPPVNAFRGRPRTSTPRRGRRPSVPSRA